jgi:hypothetical protein
MSIDATCSVGNTDKLSGYLAGVVDGQKCGMDIMKKKACREFSKILGEICSEMALTDDDIKEMGNIFRKKLDE